MKYYRDTWVEVDLDAIAHNVRCAKGKHPNKRLIAVVKANGYGHGEVEVGKAALAAGAEMLAVSSFDEALYLREYDVTAETLILGVTSIEHVILASEKNIAITVHDLKYIEEMLALPLEKPITVHLKIDSGMNRIGVVNKEEALTCFNLLADHPLVVLEGVFTHMATADEDLDYMNEQVARFKDVVANFDLSKVNYLHIENSATLMQFDFAFTGAIRLGIAMYGVHPGDDFFELDMELKPTLALYSTLAQVKQIKKGAKVGYGATYEAQADEWLGTLPIGYADGWIRVHQGRHVVVDGMECEIVGRICMDQMMIRLPKEVPAGTRVTLIGEGMPVERVSEEVGTICYETFCLISDRIPRIYKEGGQVVGISRLRFQS